jgi:hypothetical protein
MPAADAVPGWKPKGSKAKTDAARGADGGAPPLVFLLRNIEHPTLDGSVRLDCAKSAAPYLHPRLAATIQATANTEDSVLVVEIMKFVTADGSISASPPMKTIEHRE